MNSFLRNFIYSFILVLLMCGVTNAQDKNNKLHTNYNEQISRNSFTERKVYCDKLCISSIAVYGVGFTLDANSSWDKYEKNKIFINERNKKFAFNKFSLVHSVIFTTTMLLQKKYPKAMTISRFFIGGILIWASVKNYSVNYADVTIRCCVLPGPNRF